MAKSTGKKIIRALEIPTIPAAIEVKEDVLQLYETHARQVIEDYSKQPDKVVINTLDNLIRLKKHNNENTLDLRIRIAFEKVKRSAEGE